MLTDIYGPRLHSLGRLAELLQASPGEIVQAAQRAGVHVTVLLDERPYFADADLDALRHALGPAGGEPMH